MPRIMLCCGTSLSQVNNMKKIISTLLSIAIIATAFAACSKQSEQTPVEPKDFRVTAYLTADSIQDMESFYAGHIDEVTDIIYIGGSDFDIDGNIVLKDTFQPALDNIRTMIGDRDVNLYCSITGPGAEGEFDDWYDQMADQAEHHKVAFESGVLEENIKRFLDEYDFDGIFFDYEYCIKNKYWKDYNRFIVSLRKTLGDDYRIGMALSGWDLKQDKAARDATDFVELMSYDLWDDDGTHSSMELAKNDIELARKAGYDLSKIDLGLPFYARPTTHDGYWYAYKDYYEDLDDKGLYDDEETGLTFSFNTFDVIKQKTTYAIENGCGGVMIWCWSYDTDYGNEKSLFKAIDDAKQEAINK